MASTDNAPAPVSINDTSPAIYNRLISTPGGPKTGPAAFNPTVFTAPSNVSSFIHIGSAFVDRKATPQERKKN